PWRRVRTGRRPGYASTSRFATSRADSRPAGSRPRGPALIKPFRGRRAGPPADATWAVNAGPITSSSSIRAGCSPSLSQASSSGQRPPAGSTPAVRAAIRSEGDHMGWDNPPVPWREFERRLSWRSTTESAASHADLNPDAHDAREAGEDAREAG